jgi:hypothetical protein
MPIIALLAAININYKVTNVLIPARGDAEIVQSLHVANANPNITSIEIVAMIALDIAPTALIRKDASAAGIKWY